MFGTLSDYTSYTSLACYVTIGEETSMHLVYLIIYGDGPGGVGK